MLLCMGPDSPQNSSAHAVWSGVGRPLRDSAGEGSSVLQAGFATLQRCTCSFLPHKATTPQPCLASLPRQHDNPPSPARLSLGNAPQNFKERLYITDTPVRIDDDRTEEERKYPELFRQKLRGAWRRRVRAVPWFVPGTRGCRGSGMPDAMCCGAAWGPSRRGLTSHPLPIPFHTRTCSRRLVGAGQHMHHPHPGIQRAHDARQGRGVAGATAPAWPTRASPDCNAPQRRPLCIPPTRRPEHACALNHTKITQQSARGVGGLFGLQSKHAARPEHTLQARSLPPLPRSECGGKGGGRIGLEEGVGGAGTRPSPRLLPPRQSSHVRCIRSWRAGAPPRRVRCLPWR